MPERRVAVVFKVLREAGPVRAFHAGVVHPALPKVVDKVPRPRVVRQPSRHKRVP